MSSPLDAYTALAHRVVSGGDDIRGCIVMSKDGLLLAAIPDDEDTQRAWSRFISIGLPVRGVVEFKDSSWIQCSDDRVMTFVVTGPQVRAGIIMSRLDQELGRMDHAPVMTASLSLAPSPPSAATPQQPQSQPTPSSWAPPDPSTMQPAAQVENVEDEEEELDFSMLQSEFAGLHDPVQPDPPASEEPAKP